MNSRIHPILWQCFVVLLIGVRVLIVARADEQPNGPVFQGVQPEQKKEDKKPILPPYGFSEITPPGKWSAVAVFDVNQTNDPEVPVVIVGLGAYAGKGDWAKQLMVDNVTLRNRSQNQMKSVKLGWIIMTSEDRQAGKDRNAALREGFTDALFAELLPDQLQKLPNLRIDFVKEAKDLITSGKLTGMAFIQVSVAEVEFVDGSIWKAKSLGDVAP